MKKNLLYFFIFNFLSAKIYCLAPQDLHAIAEKIWNNECAGSVEGLTCWNKGENFGSFGIGHFIWYPEGQEVKFEETFPELLLFIQREGIVLPLELRKQKKCPWSSREEFYQNMGSEKMTVLRQFLLDTRDLQAQFMAIRLDKVLPLMLKALAGNNSKKIAQDVQTTFAKLQKDPRGVYAIIDYLNFKGSGVSPKETYKGEGWGLLQVLQKIPPNSQDVVLEFVEAAKFILMQRVQNSPPERNENRWLQGWLNRVDTYKKI